VIGRSAARANRRCRGRWTGGAASRWVVWAALLTSLLGCGDNTSVHVCFGDAVFCATTFNPVARAGVDQSVASGDIVILDGSSSTGGGGSIRSFAWVQTGGVPVTLTNAANAKATFVAPSVTADTDLTFKLTIVNEVGRADSSSTVVTVEPAAAAAVASALALFGGPLQPSIGGVVAAPDSCPSATAQLADDAAAAQAGLFLAARSLAVASGADNAGASAFFDAARVMANAETNRVGGVAGQVETFGFMLLGSLATERDPALGDTVAARLRGAQTLDDPAALINGRARVDDADGITIKTVGDSATADTEAISMLLAARATCPSSADALRLSEAGLRVIAARANRSD
jgi:hypothetical protein